MNIDGTNPNFISLESIQIATPCRADWNKMSGDEQARFCGSCAKNVYNFSAMTRAEAQRLLLEKEGHLCVRLHRRADGTVITSDCNVGISSMRRSAGWLRTALTAMVAAVLTTLGLKGATASPLQGKVAPAAQPTPLALTGEVAVTMGTPPVPTHTMGIVAPPKLKPQPKPSKTHSKGQGQSKSTKIRRAVKSASPKHR